MGIWAADQFGEENVNTYLVLTSGWCKVRVVFPWVIMMGIWAADQFGEENVNTYLVLTSGWCKVRVVSPWVMSMGIWAADQFGEENVNTYLVLTSGWCKVRVVSPWAMSQIYNSSMDNGLSSESVLMVIKECQFIVAPVNQSPMVGITFSPSLDRVFPVFPV